MTILLLAGIVLAVVPLTLIVGFSTFIMYNFFKDDAEAAAIMRVTFIILAFGLALIAAHFLIRYLGA